MCALMSLHVHHWRYRVDYRHGIVRFERDNPRTRSRPDQQRSIYENLANGATEHVGSFSVRRCRICPRRRTNRRRDIADWVEPYVTFSTIMSAAGRASNLGRALLDVVVTDVAEVS